ncbi:DNA alkylation repair protein [Streptomyces yaizuensis]|uniref:DNA alkylation repair protein n=1 Tax=Streptomyces yaizuensis TaxID=2989713 RepID=A0ABQ5P6I5_9ACTN|nr:DNA alkylation repair protein [Streptomyces sp. YSPA8]GLF98090.1 DNA alkylation repair protein [Streptomyces sp. YSPA8]
MTAKAPLKEQAINPERIRRIAREVHAVAAGFDPAAFTAEVLQHIPRLELKDRIAATSRALHHHLPVNGPPALELLLRSLPPSPEAAGITSDFGTHLYSPHSDYVARYHRTEDLLEPALDALRRLTGYFTAEVAVRHFLTDFPDRTMTAIGTWARDPDHRVRRLASESTRPTLPWAPRIPLPADAALPVLDQLHADPHPYVQRSVANHLHDLSDTDPDLVLATLQRWKATGRAEDKALAFIAREALRTRLKKGWPAAYEFLGYPTDIPVRLSPVHLDHATLTDGDTLAFSATLTTSTTVPLHITYVISTTTRRGTTREKIYFLTRTTAQPDQPLTLAKQHRLRSTASTTITPGVYSVALQVNGRRHPSAEFEVVQ